MFTPPSPDQKYTFQPPNKCFVDAYHLPFLLLETARHATKAKNKHGAARNVRLEGRNSKARSEWHGHLKWHSTARHGTSLKMKRAAVMETKRIAMQNEPNRGTSRHKNKTTRTTKNKKTEGTTNRMKCREKQNETQRIEPWACWLEQTGHLIKCPRIYGCSRLRLV